MPEVFSISHVLSGHNILTRVKVAGEHGTAGGKIKPIPPR